MLDVGRWASGRGAWSGVGLAAIAAVQCVLLGWWLIDPLPNARNVRPGLPQRRVMLLGTAIPQVVPGVTYRASGVGRITDGLKDYPNLPQRIPILLAGLLIAAGGMGLGELAMRGLRVRDTLSRWERTPLAFGLGMIGLAVGTLGLGRLGLLHAWGVRGALIILAGYWVVGGRFASGLDVRGMGGGKVAFAIIVAPFLLFMALAAMLGTQDYDAIEYHLQAPKEYFQNGKITFLSHNIYASMPFAVEMLHLLGMVVLGDWWRGALVGQLVVMLHAPAAAAMVGLAASRLASPRAGWYAALIYLTTPWVYRMAALPYVEGPLMFYHAAAIWAACRKDWAIVGLMAGGAMSCKYPGLVSAVIPFGVMALATRSPRSVLAFAVGVTVAIGPWLAKNVVDTGNPVYPLAHGLLGGSPWSEVREARWQNVHGPRAHSWAALRDGALDIAGRSDWQTILFTALGPLAFLRRGSRRSSVLLFTYVLYLFGTWYLLTHRLDRFWLPALPALAILAGQGADWSRSRGWSIWLGFVVTLATLTNFFYATSPLTALNEWTTDLATMPRDISRTVNGPLAAMDEALPPGARPLLVGQAAVFHLKHRVIYNTVFDDEILETLARGRSAEEVRRSLLDRGVTHVYVDWPEVERHRKPGGYGFTAWVTPEVFADLAKNGVLERMPPPGLDRDLYKVLPR